MGVLFVVVHFLFLFYSGKPFSFGFVLLVNLKHFFVSLLSGYFVAEASSFSLSLCVLVFK